jgi:hypothetical protein
VRPGAPAEPVEVEVLPVGWRIEVHALGEGKLELKLIGVMSSKDGYRLAKMIEGAARMSNQRVIVP